MIMQKYYNSIHRSTSLILQLVERTVLHTDVVKVEKKCLIILLWPNQGNIEYKEIIHL
jgi:hypothetical protein